MKKLQSRLALLIILDNTLKVAWSALVQVQTLRLEANQARAGPRSARSEGPRSVRRGSHQGWDPLEKNFLTSTKPAKAMLGDGKR